LIKNDITVNKPSALVFLSQLQPERDETIHTDLIIDNESRNAVENMMSTYKSNKIKTTDIVLSITLKDETPIYQAPRRLPPREREIVEKQVDHWINERIVEPCSSEYDSRGYC